MNTEHDNLDHLHGLPHEEYIKERAKIMEEFILSAPADKRNAIRDVQNTIDALMTDDPMENLEELFTSMTDCLDSLGKAWQDVATEVNKVKGDN